ncbi:hypothetical protein P4O66_003096, partial [Electrophorus voltai]
MTAHHLKLNSSKTELVFNPDSSFVTYEGFDPFFCRKLPRRARRAHSPLAINGSSVEIVKNIKFLGVHIAGEPHLDPEHQFHHQESPAMSLLPSEAEGSPSPITHPHYLLQ